MTTPIREFLDLERHPVDELTNEELASEVDGWRVVFSLLPREVAEWMARLHGVVRFTKRNYQGSTGVLLGFKLEATEFTIGIVETAFDSLKGERVIEDKILQIPAGAVMYVEFIGDVSPYDSAQTEEALAVETLG